MNNMILKKHKRSLADIPLVLQQIPQPPKELFVLGESLDTLLSKPCVSIVGSRRVTPYGQTVTEMLATELAKRGVVIISGLALGVDGIAHRAALRAGGKCIAVLPSGLDSIHPRTNHSVAKEILQTGGVLLSEYPDGTPPRLHHFVARNRLVSGLGDVLLITEAAAKSGTLHTINFALEQGRTVMAVPGNITSEQSRGTNNIIKTGAIPVTDVADILQALGLDATTKTQEIIANNQEEHTILTLIQQGTTDGNELLHASHLTAQLFNQTLTMLEITGRIKPLGNNHWTLL